MQQGTGRPKPNEGGLVEDQETQTPPSRQAGSNQPQGQDPREQASDRPVTSAGRSASSGPLSFLNDLRSEIDRLFDDFGLGQGLTFPSVGSFSGWMDWSPQTEVFHRDNELVIQADLPGISKDDINIDIEGDQLTIRGERRVDETIRRDRYQRFERSYGSFSRSFTIPSTIDAGRINATYKDGVLTVRLPQREEAKPKQIEVTE